MKTKCKCGKLSENITDDCMYIQLYVPENNHTGFQELFEPHLKELKCDFCQNLDQIDETSYILSEEQKFVIVRLNNQVYDKTLNQSRRIKTIVKLFDSENSIFPGTNIEFKLISCVQHLSNTDKCGHYVCWVRRKENWLMISDGTAHMMRNFITDLEDVYFLVFEKI